MTLIVLKVQFKIEILLYLLIPKRGRSMKIHMRRNIVRKIKIVIVSQLMIISFKQYLFENISLFQAHPLKQ